MDHVMTACEPMWALRDQSIHDCAHAAGHGFFYYFQDIGSALKACWTDAIMQSARHWLSAETLLVWRWGALPRISSSIEAIPSDGSPPFERCRDYV